MLTLTLPQFELPDGYVVHPSPKGFKHYVNLETNTGSWRHPSIYKALQDLGIVDCPEKRSTVAPWLEALNEPDFEVPAPWRRVRNKFGVVSYINDVGTQIWVHPYVDGGAVFPPWVALQGDNGQTYYWNEDEERSQAVNPYLDIINDAFMAAEEREEDYWQNNGHLPPWIIKEVTVPEPGGQAVPYCVNYRTGTCRPL